MKNMILTLSLFVCLSAISSVFAAEPFVPDDGREYGVTPSGIYFVSKNMVQKVEGQAPKFMSSITNWKRKGMKLSGAYYVYASGKNVKRIQIFCFDVGGGSYLPHLLITLGLEDAFIIKHTDVIDNEGGGFNFRVEPAK